MASDKLSFKAQLFGLLALLLLLMASSVGVALRYLDVQNEKNDYITDVVAERVIVAEQWITSLLESARHIRNTLILDEPALIGKELVGLREEIQERKDHLAELKRLSNDVASRRLFEQIISAREIYLPLEQDFARLIDTGQFKAAKTQLLTTARPAQLAYLDRLYKYIEPAREQMRKAAAASTAEMESVRRQVLGLGVLTVLFAGLIGWRVTRNMLRQLGGEPQAAVAFANRIAQGEHHLEAPLARADQHSLMHALNAMARALTHNHLAKERSDWIKTGLAELNLITRRELPPQELGQAVLRYAMHRLQAVVGALYFYQAGSQDLQRVAAEGLLDEPGQSRRFPLGQGLVGGAAQNAELQHISPLPAGYLRASSGTGEAAPAALLLLPLFDAGGLIGLLELGAFQGFDEMALEFSELAREGIGLGLGSALSRQRTHELLATTQAQSEELQSQQEELEQNNQELQAHAQALESQRRELDLRNAELGDSSRELERRAQELEQVSRYKSEFLANMSHELRTPLNSMLMLSALLQDDREQCLSEKQSKFAGAIHAAGQDLLSLINDILDLSKIEAGQVEYLFEPHTLDELIEPLRQMFTPLAQQKGLRLDFSLAPALPSPLRLDLRRTQQVLKNLLSNAIKFTQQGQVELKLQALTAADSPLGQATLALAVSDSGIGIAADKQALVFEAFKQADGSISRSYGGTGLGLSISRQLAQGLQGQLNLLSQIGQGSTFTLLLPLEPRAGAAVDPPPPASSSPAAGARLLIVEDHPTEAYALSELLSGPGMQIDIASSGRQALDRLQQARYDALVLDLGLGDMRGEDLLQQIRQQHSSASLPVLVHSGRQPTPSQERSLRHLAQALIVKGDHSPARVRQDLQALLAQRPPPADQAAGSSAPAAPAATALAAEISSLRGRTVLLADDDMRNVFAIGSLLSYHGVRLIEAENGHEALSLLSANPQIELILMDIMMPEMDGYAAMRAIRALGPGSAHPEQARLPIIAMTAKTMPGDREACLAAGASDYIAKPLDKEQLLSMMQVWLGPSPARANDD
ncbi:signal transduction histidine kinase/CheY-like chemotaxis protein [Paucibacter oligotrophus]|uniref:Virulence sensor protein BvgS n=1 Tax=Roseateles oligotrophus TaxID=1769250 RepID=A0A840LKW3_9BURK|nr:response regulator [Roseateles oligotrophus]MBB4845937.1 signal transduction histidine kinase/CheY-like chemotaxis protein [Roseateles oligotrophus]